MSTSLILAFYFFLQGDIPFKNSDEYQVQVDLTFRTKQSQYEPNSYSTDGIRLDKAARVEAFLIVNLTQLKILGDEARVQAIDSKGRSIFKKKCSPHDLRVEMGFLSDLKKGDGTNEITVFFLSADKKELRRILLTVLSDGTFQVNGKWHGKF